LSYRSRRNPSIHYGFGEGRLTTHSGRKWRWYECRPLGNSEIAIERVAVAMNAARPASSNFCLWFGFGMGDQVEGRIN
jgi:hypothetical protein